MITELPVLLNTLSGWRLSDGEPIYNANDENFTILVNAHNDLIQMVNKIIRSLENDRVVLQPLSLPM